MIIGRQTSRYMDSAAVCSTKREDGHGSDQSRNSKHLWEKNAPSEGTSSPSPGTAEEFFCSYILSPAVHENLPCTLGLVNSLIRYSTGTAAVRMDTLEPGFRRQDCSLSPYFSLIFRDIMFYKMYGVSA